MGSLNNGVFGGFQGRVGNLVGYMLNGKNVVRTIGKSCKPPTLPKKANYQRMTVVNKFLNPMKRFIKSGFDHATRGTDRNAYNEAVSYNKKHALKGEYPNISMDYPKAMLSKGSLLPAIKPGIEKVGEAIIFHWEVPDSGPAIDHKWDRAMLLVYLPGPNTSHYSLSGARRQEGKDLVYIDPKYAHEQIEAYISFISPDGKQISDSVYVGTIAKDTVIHTAKTAEIIPASLTDTAKTTKFCAQISQSPTLFNPLKHELTYLYAPPT